MKGEEFEPCRLDVRFESMKLDTITVINEHIFLLRYGEMRLIVQKPRYSQTSQLYESEIEIFRLTLYPDMFPGVEVLCAGYLFASRMWLHGLSYQQQPNA